MYFKCASPLNCGPGIVVGIATGYGLHGQGIEPRWRRNFPHLSRPALGPTQPPVQWVPGISRGQRAAGRDADPSPPSSAVVKKEQSYTSTPPVGRTACTEPQCLYKGAPYLFLLHLTHDTHGNVYPYSVPVQTDHNRYSWTLKHCPRADLEWIRPNCYASFVRCFFDFSSCFSSVSTLQTNKTEMTSAPRTSCKVHVTSDRLKTQIGKCPHTHTHILIKITNTKFTENLSGKNHPVSCVRTLQG